MASGFLFAILKKEEDLEVNSCLFEYLMFKVNEPKGTKPHKQENF